MTRPGPTLAIPRGLLVLGRLAVAAVWVYEGLVAKILAERADERAILAQLPVVGGHARAVAIAIGSWELVLALLVLAGRLPRLTAVAETLTLLVFNTGGLLVGSAEIPEPVHLLVTNLAFLVLAWFVAVALVRPRGAAVPDA